MLEKVIGVPDKALILLAARGGEPEYLLGAYKNVKDVAICSLVGPGNQWYPAPNGPYDQREAIRGIPKSVKLVKGYVKRMAKEFGHSRIFLAGYSAGGVIALQVVAHSQEALGGVQVHCGAILDPESLPEAPNDTPVFVSHSENDMVFTWDERYLPMKEALTKNKYNCKFLERKDRGHSVLPDDIKTFIGTMK